MRSAFCLRSAQKAASSCTRYVIRCAFCASEAACGTALIVRSVQVVLGGTESNFKPPHKTTSDSTNSSNSNSLRFFAHLKRGKKDQRVTALQFLNSKSGDLRLLCGGEEGGVQIWDVATLKLVEQHRKHGSTEVMAVTASASLDPSFVVAGDRQGRISAWKRDEYVRY